MKICDVKSMKEDQPESVKNENLVVLRAPISSILVNKNNQPVGKVYIGPFRAIF